LYFKEGVGVQNTCFFENLIWTSDFAKEGKPLHDETQIRPTTYSPRNSNNRRQKIFIRYDPQPLGDEVLYYAHALKISPLHIR
jgi:hypothetical protein